MKEQLFDKIAHIMTNPANGFLDRDINAFNAVTKALRDSSELNTLIESLSLEPKAESVEGLSIGDKVELIKETAQGRNIGDQGEIIGFHQDLKDWPRVYFGVGNVECMPPDYVLALPSVKPENGFDDLKIFLCEKYGGMPFAHPEGSIVANFINEFELMNSGDKDD